MLIIVFDFSFPKQNKQTVMQYRVNKLSICQKPRALSSDVAVSAREESVRHWKSFSCLSWVASCFYITHQEKQLC